MFSSANAANHRGLPGLRLAAVASSGNNANSIFWVEGPISGPYSLTKVGTSAVVLDGGATLASEVTQLVVSNGLLTVTPSVGTASVQVACSPFISAAPTSRSSGPAPLA